MSKSECIRDLMEQGRTSQEATKICGELFESKVTPGIKYRSIVPGARTTPGRVAYERVLRRQKAVGRRRRRFRGVPRG